MQKMCHVSYYTSCCCLCGSRAGPAQGCGSFSCVEGMVIIETNRVAIINVEIFMAVLLDAHVSPGGQSF